VRGKVGQGLRFPLVRAPEGAYAIGIKIGRRSPWMCCPGGLDFTARCAHAGARYEFPDPERVYGEIAHRTSKYVTSGRARMVAGAAVPHRRCRARSARSRPPYTSGQFADELGALRHGYVERSSSHAERGRGGSTTSTPARKLKIWAGPVRSGPVGARTHPLPRFVTANPRLGVSTTCSAMPRRR